MVTYDNLNDFLDSVPVGRTDGITFEIQSAFLNAWAKIHGYRDERGGHSLYPNIVAAVSGGADSDIVTDLIERIGHPYSEVRYLFYDTGMEFDATKRHLTFLENKYGIRIERKRAKIPVPHGVKKYGVPFLSRRISDYMHRLQKHGFQWEDRPLEELTRKYPRCQSALRWWCGEWGAGSQMNITRHRWLREFIAEHPPDFPISDGCCTGAKKATARMMAGGADLNIQGLRRAEGGARAAAYRSCFTEVWGGADTFRPVFWFTNHDREVYARVFGVTHSDCYAVYDLTRTGCACCPFGRNFEMELNAAKKYEPKLYKAASGVFRDSYRYTREYREYARARDAEVRTT